MTIRAGGVLADMNRCRGHETQYDFCRELSIIGRRRYTLTPIADPPFPLSHSDHRGQHSARDRVFKGGG